MLWPQLLRSISNCVLNNLGGEQLKKITQQNDSDCWTLYCTLYGVLHTIWCTAYYIAYCTLHSTLFTAHCKIPVDLTQAKTNPHSSSLFLQTRNVQLSQKCTVFSVLINIQCAVRRVVCSTPYSVQYIILHTLKILYLNNFGGAQVKKNHPIEQLRTFGHCTASNVAYCALYGVLNTTWCTAHCTALNIAT